MTHKAVHNRTIQPEGSWVRVALVTWHKTKIVLITKARAKTDSMDGRVIFLRYCNGF